MPRFLVAVIVTAILAVPPTIASADEPGFKPLFNGRSLVGWEGNEKLFRVEDGVIVAGSLTDRIPNNEFLVFKDEFGDFELRLRAKLVGEGQNAGIQFRSQRVPDHFEMIGYQCDMGTAGEKSIWGALYDESRRRKFLAEPEQQRLLAVLKKADWNDLVIRCEGPRVQLWVNGLKTVDYTEPDADVPRTGRIGLQIHGGAPAEASYKDIRIKQLD
jgi:hypothetical protein